MYWKNERYRQSTSNIFSLAIQQELKIEDIEFTDFYFEHGYKDPRGLNRILARLVRENEGRLCGND